MSATPEQPPAAPDEPVTTVHEPMFAAPEPPTFEPVPPIDRPASDTAGGGLTEQHPEVLVGGAFVGGAVLALVLKRLGRS